MPIAKQFTLRMINACYYNRSHRKVYCDITEKDKLGLQMCYTVLLRNEKQLEE